MYHFIHFVALFSLLSVAGFMPSYAQTIASQPPATNASSHVISVSQPDGSSLRIVGKGNRHVSYTETADGYTVLKNERHVYEYARPGKHGKLVASGVKASNPDERATNEKEFLQTISPHLRYLPPYVDTLRKPTNR